jgi:predicted nuclease of predicted toxin-antitoxin system
MKILVDMNLSPVWVSAFAEVGIEAVHWSEIGDPGAADAVLMDWARINSHVVFTHDLDFGTALALTQLNGPSIIQVRTHDVTPNYLLKTILDIVQQNKLTLESGALIVVDEARSRLRILPLMPREP